LKITNSLKKNDALLEVFKGQMIVPTILPYWVDIKP